MHDQVPRGQVHAGTVTTVTAGCATGSCLGLHKDRDEVLSDLRESLSFLRGLGMESTLTRTLPAVVVTFAVGHSTAVLACKVRQPPEHLSTGDVDASSDIVVAAVEGTQPNGVGNQVEEMFGRPRPFKARIKIERSLKGQTSPGDVVSIETSKGEESHAVCPLDLSAGLSYLLFLTRDGNQLRVSRYLSMTTAMEDPRAAIYVRDVESRVRSTPPSEPSPKVEEAQPSKSRDGGAQ
jgi:hypothetical protein